MRRIVLWALSTLTVLVLLFGYHTSTSSHLGSTASAVAAPTPSPAAPDPGASDETSSGGASDDEAASGSSDSSGSDSSDAGSSGSGSASSGSAKGSPAATTVTGDVAQTQWGPVQVAITVADGTITDVAVPQYPNGNPRDTQINAYALPVLVQETIDAQSASIDMVSGATVTSQGYLTSLQSALDQAGL